MRIVVATSRRSLIGGLEKYLQSVLPGLLNRGHSIGMLYEHPFDGQGETVDPPHAQLPLWCVGESGLEATLGSLANWDPDVVYCHGFDDTAIESALNAAHATTFYAHSYFGTCISGRKCHTWPRPEPCGRRFGPSCLLLYFPRRCGGLHPGTMWRMFEEQSQRKSNLRGYRAVLVASHHMYRELEQHGVTSTRLHLAPLPTGDVREAVGSAAKTPGSHILFVGRLMDVKGVHYLLQAIPRASEQIGRPLTLTIAGEGPERQKLQRLAQTLGVTAVFEGWVDDRRKLELIEQADLLAMPSLWPEPFGLAGIEAGCLGVPAVGYAVGGIPDWLISGRSGELAPGDPPTVKGLAQAIVRALSTPDHYAKLSSGAREQARQFSLERHIVQLEQILATVQTQQAEASVLSHSD